MSLPFFSLQPDIDPDIEKMITRYALRAFELICDMYRIDNIE